MPLPWVSAAHVLSGSGDWKDWLSAILWVAAAYAFGRWQFERSLRFDQEAARSAGDSGAKESGVVESFFRIPGRVLPDPIGAMVEKEIRSLLRSPRFRLLFIMGFSFGLLIWLPMMFGRKNPSVMASYFLVIICAYAITLLSEVLVWNTLGYDRSAAQFYWLVPMPPRYLMIAKNLTALLLIFLQILIITAICLVFRLPVTIRMFADAVLVCMLLMVLLMSVGNYSSLRFPRAVDPRESWKRSAATKFQALLLLLYPVLAIPFAFAYWARTVWEAQWPFYTVIGFVGISAITAYSLSLDSAERIAIDEKERILNLLGQGEDPMAA